MPVEDEINAGRRHWLRSTALLTLAASLAPWARAQTAIRTALVIGNARYPVSPVANAVNDARLVASTVKDLGFDTTLLLDANFDGMLDAAKRWLAGASAADVRLVYFAGHGAQFRGRNFLIPLDARPRSEDDLPGCAFSANDLIDRLSRFSTGVNVVVLDACRSMAMPAPVPGSRMRGGGDAVQPLPGLSATIAPKGTLVAYSTLPGAVAADNPQMKNSIFTRHFVEQLKNPGLPIETVFKRTRAAVERESGGTQIPSETSTLVGDACFAPNAAGVCGDGN